MKIIALAVAAAALAGCAPLTRDGRFFATSYEVGRATESAVGSALVSVSVTDIFARKSEERLVYGGVSGTTIRFTYREFTDDLARPAFTQELQYDLAQSDEIAFRRMRIKVLKATNTRIVAIVLEDDGVAARAAEDAAAWAKRVGAPPPAAAGDSL